MRIAFPLPLRLLVLASLIATLMAFASASARGADDSHPVVWGDVSCDSVVNLPDVADLMRRSSGIETSNSCPQGQPAASSASALTFRLDPVNLSAQPNETVSVSVFVDVNTVDLGLGNASFEVAFDPSILTPVSCMSDFAGCNATFSPNSAKFALAAIRDAGLHGTLQLGSVQFSVHGSVGHTTNISIKAINAGDQLGHPLSSAAGGATISISAAGATPTPTPAPGAYWHYADVNCDNAVNVLDALGVLEYLVVGHAGFAHASSCPSIGS